MEVKEGVLLTILLLLSVIVFDLLLMGVDAIEGEKGVGDGEIGVRRGERKATGKIFFVECNDDNVVMFVFPELDLFAFKGVKGASIFSLSIVVAFFDLKDIRTEG